MSGRALVTGAGGCVGRALVERLAAGERPVRALVYRPENAAALSDAEVEVVQGDVRDRDAMERAVAGCDLVYHLAGRISARGGSAAAFRSTNVEGTRVMAQAALRAGVERFVHVSTVGVHGAVDGEVVDEEREPAPDSDYRRSKLEGERVALALHRDGLPVVVARLASVIGPASLGWIGLFRAIAGGRFRPIGRGERHQSLLYASDAADAFVRCGESPTAVGEAYVVASDETASLATLMGWIAEAVGADPPAPGRPEAPFRLYRRVSRWTDRAFGVSLPRAHDHELFLASRLYDISKARTELGFAPTVAIREAVDRTAEWYERAGWLRPE